MSWCLPLWTPQFLLGTSSIMLPKIHLLLLYMLTLPTIRNKFNTQCDFLWASFYISFFSQFIKCNCSISNNSCMLLFRYIHFTKEERSSYMTGVCALVTRQGGCSVETLKPWVGPIIMLVILLKPSRYTPMVSNFEWMNESNWLNGRQNSHKNIICAGCCQNPCSRKKK